jgi:hypothetical protein
VAASSAEAAKAGAECLKQSAGELARQFKGVVLRPPDVVGPVSLATGETFLRVHVPIWPQQQWVVEQQFVPRLREILKARGLEVPGDRIVAFYHARMERPVSPWRRGLGKLKRFVPGGRTKNTP